MVLSHAKAGCAALALALVLPAAVLAQDPSGDQGQVAFNNACRTCHTVKEGDNRLGPSLHGVVGREAGSLPDYAYSSAMTASGVVWDEAALDRFLANPDGAVPGHNMKPFTGIASAEDRATIIAYLKTQSGGDAPEATGKAPAN